MKVKVITKNGHKVVDLNRRKAIKLKCLDCSGFCYKEVANCSFTDCELYPYRTGKEKQNAKARKKAITKYCLSCCTGQYSLVSKCPSTDCPLFCYRKTKIDRSSEIQSLPKNEHIEPTLENEIAVGIP